MRVPVVPSRYPSISFKARSALDDSNVVPHMPKNSLFQRTLLSIPQIIFIKFGFIYISETASRTAMPLAAIPYAQVAMIGQAMIGQAHSMAMSLSRV